MATSCVRVAGAGRGLQPWRSKGAQQLTKPLSLCSCRCRAWRNMQCRADMETQQTHSSPEDARLFHPLKSEPLEHRAAPKRHQILEQAQDELCDYCSSLPGVEESEICWSAYWFLTKRWEEAKESCSVEEGTECPPLEKFEDFVRELIAQGQIGNTVLTLSVLATGEKRRLEEGGAAGDKSKQGASGLVEEALAVGLSEVAAAAAVPSTHTPRGKAELRAFFRSMDLNGDGKLNTAEFRDAMQALGDELSGHRVQVISDALDLHGQLDEDQFIAVVEAEEIRAHSQLASLLRRHGRESTWWSKSYDDK